MKLISNSWIYSSYLRHVYGPNNFLSIYFIKEKFLSRHKLFSFGCGLMYQCRLTEKQFLHGNISLKCLQNEDTLFIYWQRSVINKVNDWNLNQTGFLNPQEMLFYQLFHIWMHSSIIYKIYKQTRDSIWCVNIIKSKNKVHLSDFMFL